jgi:hypothetical protein
MHLPGAAEALERLQRDEASVRALLGEVVGPADTGDAGADDQHIEVLDLRRLRRFAYFGCRHGIHLSGP